MAKTDSQSVIDPKSVWFITGCSSGFGRELAKHVIECGYPVAVTARNPRDIEDIGQHGDAMVLKLDVTDENQADEAVSAVMEKYGRIDVLVNNAGIGYLGAIEESEEQPVRHMFDVNVFGVGRMIYIVLPYMRKQRHGLIINISSIGGLVSFPGVGYYNATKFALEGLSEALWKEVEPLGIHVMLVEPSGFRTKWSTSAAQSKHLIDEYSQTAAIFRRENVQASAGKQPGDPVRAARAIVEAAQSPNPPHRLLLGNNAYDLAIKKLDEIRKEFVAWENVARSADFPTVRNAV